MQIGWLRCLRGTDPPLACFIKEYTMSKAEFDREFANLRLRHEALKEQVANQIEMYAHLVETEGPNIEAQYMMLVGQLEYQVMRLDMEVRRWKRRFILRQMCLNRGEKPDLVAIEALLDKEFGAWREKIAALIKKLEGSKLQFDAAKMSDSDTNAIRCEYLKAVKKLHPDLNKHLSVAAKSLWNQTQKAYSAKHWSQLKFLVSLVDEVVARTEDFTATPDGLAELREACAQLEAKSREVAEQIAALKSTVPFTYTVLLEDPLLLKQKQDSLNKKIQDLKAAIKKYERTWNNV